MIKKCISLCLTMLLLLSFNSIVFAESDTTSASIRVSEYELLKPYLGKSLDKLLEMGLSEDEAKRMMNIEESIINQIKEYSSYSNSELNKLGFSKEQTEAIKNKSFTKTSKLLSEETMISEDSPKLSKDMIEMLSSATVTLKCSSAGKSGSKYEFDYNWYWSGRPFVLHEDTIAFAWDGGFRVSRSDIYSTIEYSGGDWDYEKSFNSNSDIEIGAGKGWKGKLEMMAMPQKQNDAYARRGHGYFRITNPDNEKDIQIVWGYGHTTYGNGGFCLNFGLPSLSVVPGADKIYENDDTFKTN